MWCDNSYIFLQLLFLHPDGIERARSTPDPLKLYHMTSTCIDSFSGFDVPSLHVVQYQNSNVVYAFLFLLKPCRLSPRAAAAKVTPIAFGNHGHLAMINLLPTSSHSTN